jgi:DNA-binding NarL/FixJ family response regulator
MSPQTILPELEERAEAPVATGDFMQKQAPTIKILIADDRALLRDALRKLLEREPDFDVIGAAKNSTEVQDMLAKFKPDVLLLDLNMRRESGLEIMRTLNGIARDVRIILLSSCVENGEVVEALRLGARGVVKKTSPSHLLYKGIRAVMTGEYWVDHKSISDLVRALQVAPTPARSGGSANSFSLTPREHEILHAIMDGCTNREIGQKFSISAQTVKHHLTSIFQKVGVPNRLELALLAMNNRLNFER